MASDSEDLSHSLNNSRLLKKIRATKHNNEHKKEQPTAPKLFISDCILVFPKKALRTKHLRNLIDLKRIFSNSSSSSSESLDCKLQLKKDIFTQMSKHDVVQGINRSTSNRLLNNKDPFKDLDISSKVNFTRMHEHNVVKGIDESTLHAFMETNNPFAGIDLSTILDIPCESSFKLVRLHISKSPFMIIKMHTKNCNPTTYTAFKSAPNSIRAYTNRATYNILNSKNLVEWNMKRTREYLKGGFYVYKENPKKIKVFKHNSDIEFREYYVIDEVPYFLEAVNECKNPDKVLSSPTIIYDIKPYELLPSADFTDVILDVEPRKQISYIKRNKQLCVKPKKPKL